MTKSEFIAEYAMARASSAIYAHPHDVLSDAEIYWDTISKEQLRERESRIAEVHQAFKTNQQ
jgi:hypothetical protein